MALLLRYNSLGLLLLLLLVVLLVTVSTLLLYGHPRILLLLCLDSWHSSWGDTWVTC